MYITFLLILGCLFFILKRRTSNRLLETYKKRLTSENWLLDAYGIYNKHVYPFDTKISTEEQRYIYSIINNYDYRKEFENTYDISPYSFSITVEKDLNKVNLSRVNIGSVEKDVDVYINRLLQYVHIDDTLCAQGYKYYGVGWDLDDGVIKFYTLSTDKCKIECYVYKVQRNYQNEITSSTFKTKKTYDVGETITVMYKDGKEVQQVNLPRPTVIDTRNHVANNWIRNMQQLGFIIDTYSDYDDKINLYFD